MADKWEQFVEQPASSKWDKFAEESSAAGYDLNRSNLAFLKGAQDIGKTVPQPQAQQGALGQIMTRIGAKGAEMGQGMLNTLTHPSQWYPLNVAQTAQQVVQQPGNTLAGAVGIDRPALAEAAANRDIPGMAVEAGVPLAMAAGGAALAGKGRVPAGPDEAVNKLYAASGVSPSTKAAPQLIRDIQTVQSELKAAPVKPQNVAQAAKVFEQASQSIEQKIGPLVQQYRGTPIDTVPLQAQLRSQMTPTLKAFSPGAYSDMQATIKSLQTVKNLGQLDEVRKILNGENKSIMKKQGLDYYTASHDPAIGYRLDLHESVRQLLADQLEQASGRTDIRQLRTQQSSYMRLADTFDKRAQALSAERRLEAAQPARVKVGSAIGKVTQYAVDPRKAAFQSLTQPTSADALVKEAFK